MVKMQIDTTNERKYFLSRSDIKRPRRAPKVTVVTTQIETKRKRKKRTIGNAYQHSNTGARNDLDGLVVRSNWEANVIRVLNLFKIDFEFEPKKFTFPPTPGGKVYSYLPDIYLPMTDEWIEVKGYLDSAGRMKLRKFKKFEPIEFSKLTVIISRSNKANQVFFKKLGVPTVLYYENISAAYAAKVNWEGAK